MRPEHPKLTRARRRIAGNAYGAQNRMEMKRSRLLRYLRAAGLLELVAAEDRIDALTSALYETRPNPDPDPVD
jgi:hypothetical protein